MYDGHNGSATPIKNVSITDARDGLECNAESKVIGTDSRNIEVSTPSLEDNLEQIEGTCVLLPLVL